MKIAFILPGRGRFGGVRSTVVAANHLLARGHRVRIFYGKQSLTPKTLLKNTLKRLLHSNNDDWLDDFHGPLIAYHDIVKCKFYPDEIVVSVGMWCSAQLSKLDCLANPKLQYFRGMTPWMPNVMEKALLLPIPKVAVSSSVSSTIRLYGGDVLGVVHNGINQEEYYPSSDESLRDGIGTIYSPHPAKDPGTVLRVLKKLSAEMPNVPHYIFGSSQRPRQIRKNDYVRLPSVEQARNLYSRSLVWILGSSSEGLPNPVLEAMACGCAVVATDCGGVCDIIRDGENGFVVDVGNVGQIVERAKLLLTNSELCQKVVKKSKQTINRFTWESSVDKLEAVLKSINGTSL